MTEGTSSEGSRLHKGLSALLILALAQAASAQATPTVQRVTIRGLSTIPQNSVLTAMTLTVGQAYSESRLEEDRVSIENLGLFREVRVFGRPITEFEYEVLVEVVENPVIKEIRISGNTVFPSEKIREQITQQIDQVFNLRTVDPTVLAIAQLYQKEGYFALADIDPLEEAPGTLNVVIRERQVNDIVVTGLRKTRPSIIRRLIKTKPGEAYSRFKWDADIRRLESTGWFESIQATEPLAGTGRSDLNLDLKELNTGQIGLGASLDPRSRLAGQLRFGDTNFNGTGQSIILSLQQDTAGTGLSSSIDYSNPFMDSRDTALSARVFSRVFSYFGGSGFNNNNSPDSERFDERRTGFQIGLSRPFGRQYVGTVGLSGEEIKTLKLRLTGNQFVQQDGTILTFLAQVSRDRRDVPLDPMEGDFTRLTIEPAFINITRVGGSVGSNTDILGKGRFLRTGIEYKTFFSKRPEDLTKIGNPRQVLAFRARYGTILGTVPFFEQFFLGGADSLRGYNDQRFWGKNVFAASGEYRYPIQRQFNIIGFVDYGGAWGGYGTFNDFSQSRTAKFHLGYGTGVGFRTPLGLIRIDFGFTPKGESRTHFSIGGSF